MQAQSQIAFSEMAKKTNDPGLLAEAVNFQRRAQNFNAMMMNPRFRQVMGSRAVTAGLDANSIMNEFNSIYSPGAQQITSYLTGFNINGNNVRNGATQTNSNFHRF